jgi:predicted amidohydrolase
MKLTLAQYPIEVGQPKINLAKVETIIRPASQDGSDLVLLPELCLHGYHSESIKQNKAYHLQGILPALAGLARSARLAISGSFVEEDGEQRFNTMIYVDSNGQLLAKYRKTHLFKPLNEHRYFHPGDHICTVQTDFGKLGLAICYDLRFPELFRAMIAEGVEGFLVSAEWPIERISHWQAMLRSRAIENLSWVAACNCIGGTHKTTFGGSSLFFTPWGESKAQLEGETSQTIEFDPSISRMIREENPFLDDIRKH